MKRGAALLVAIVAASFGATVGAMRHTSTTFDEAYMVATAAQGFVTGQFEVIEHPPLMQYLYGLPVFLSRPNYPPEPDEWSFGTEHSYGQLFFWRSGNDPERLAFLARLVAAALAAGLVLAAYFFTRRAAGSAAALLAAFLVAFLPDVLAHGGIAYNDLPMALAFLCVAWAVDAALRDPGLKRAVVAGGLFALALGVKFSAVALAPVAVLLVAAQASSRGGDRTWRREVLRFTPVALLAAYLGLVLIYRGDFTLDAFRYRFGLNMLHARVGHIAPAYLLGRQRMEGWWYFFPVAFLFKTPAALHALVALAGLGFFKARHALDWRSWLRSPLRVPALAAAVYCAFLFRTSLNIGFRHALPAVVLLCILVAVGVARLWESGGRRVRAALLALLLAYAASSLSYYPHFLAYLSEYRPSRDQGYRVLVDSSFDWGQGLLALRDYMREEGIARVYLSYFGSALPDGYGIDYVPLPSFFPLPAVPARPDAPRPAHVVISATNLVGLYLAGDPFAGLRDVPPERVLAHTLFVYRLSGPAP